MITREVTVWCDRINCGEWVQGVDGLTALRTQLRSAGWKSDAQGDLCPHHRRLEAAEGDR